MRVVAGEFRGRKLECLDGIDIRPTLDRVKESLFNIIAIDVLEGDFLDLFSGSGAIGIEAISRGAKEVVFVDESIKSIKVLKNNLEKLKIDKNIEIFNDDCSMVVEKLFKEKRFFDIIFMDPPYSKGIVQALLKKININKILKEDGTIIVEHDIADILQQKEGDIALVRQKKYGSTMLSFYKINKN